MHLEQRVTARCITLYDMAGSVLRVAMVIGDFPGFRVLAWLLVVAAVPVNVHAQQLEPRFYTNAPVGFSSLLTGYSYTEGNLSFDPSVPVENADLRTNSAVLVLARTLDVRGRSAKLDVVLPYTWLSGTALVDGEPRRREVSGFADARLRYSVNFSGAPALSLREFQAYRQNLIIGGSLQLTVPVGQYDDDKAVNIGTNRWALKPELGMSKAWGPWSLDVAVAATLFTDNRDFLGDGTVAQDPLYSLQSHIVYDFPSRAWIALDGTWYYGGRTTVNDLRQDTLKNDTRLGLTLVQPLTRHFVFRIYASTGISARTGDENDEIGIAGQYLWWPGSPR